jgi:hypothetical protein
MTQAVVRTMNDYEDAESGAMVPFDAYSAGEMALRLADLKSRLDVVQQFFREVMVEGQDYGVIPGTDKPSLLKPGAEKLAELYGYAPIVKSIDEVTGADGFYEVKVTMALVSRKTASTVAEGIGSANTFEARYRYRWLFDNQLPKGIDKAALHHEERFSKKKNTHFVMYRIENDDLYSLWNTVLKMAKKRALVDVVLSATRSSGLFTQDAEAFEEYVEGGAEGAQDPPIQQPRRKSQKAAPNVDKATGEVKPSGGPDFNAFWRDARALGFNNRDVIEQAGVESVEGFDQDQLDELLTQLREKSGKPQPALMGTD